MSESNPRATRSKPSPEQATAPAAAKPSIVRIVGTGEGIVMRIGDKEGRWVDIVRVLADHLAKAEGFFQGERVAIEIGQRALTADDMQLIADVLAGYNVTIWAVRTSNPETRRMVQEIGLTAEPLESPAAGEGKGERARWEVRLGQKASPVPAVKPIEEFHPPQAIADAIADQVIEAEEQAQAEADAERASTPRQRRGPVEESRHPATDGAEDEVAGQEVIFAPPYIYRGTLRSGQVFRHAGTVMVVGDVNPGAEVISGGDIFIWGKLRGIVHAGAMGNERSVVCAIDFEPIQLRIAGFIAMSPKAVSNEPGRWFWRRSPLEKPEVARVIGKQIVVDVWDSQQ